MGYYTNTRSVLFAAFAAIELRRDQPLVPLGIFRTHNLSAANTVMALLGAACIPMWSYLNLYLQRVLGFGAFESGAALLPMTVAIMVLMVGVTGRLVARYGFKPPMIAGLALSPPASACSPGCRSVAASQPTSSAPRSSPRAGCRSPTSPS